MNINSINYQNYQPLSFDSSNNLSANTRQTLIALGINPDSVSSEEEAKALIIQLLTQKVQIAKFPQTNTNYSSGSEIISKAKSLAAQAGVNIDTETSISKMLQTLTDRISAHSKTPEKEKYQSQLKEIEREYSLMEQNEKSMYSSMNYTAELNKMILGL